MTRPTPASHHELLVLVDETGYEMEELSRCVEEELDDETADLAPVFASMAGILARLKTSIENRVPEFEPTADLPFMSLARRYRHVIPFFSMLDAINRGHLEGIGYDGS